MTWEQNYDPLGGSLALSSMAAAIPLFVLFFMLGVKRTPAWVAASTALGSALVVAFTVYDMPVALALLSAAHGAAFGIFPIAWIVFSSILLYRLAVETGKFEIIKASVGGLTKDRRLQAIFIAFSFGAFIEGAAGFGAPVAISGAMLAGLGFPPFFAAGICLLANTAPVAFGSLGIPVTTLANVTGLPVMALSAMVGRLCAMISLVIPAYLVVVMSGLRRAYEVLPAIVVCGVSFALTQFLVSNYVGPELTDILSSLTGIGAMVLVIKLWQPRTILRLDGDDSGMVPDALKELQPPALESGPSGGPTSIVTVKRYSTTEVIWAWSPYILLVVFVLIWGNAAIKAAMDRLTTVVVPIPGLHNAIVRVPPVSTEPALYGAVFTLNWLSAAGTACFLAGAAAAVVLRVRAAQFAGVYRATFKQLSLPMATIAFMLALAYVMNYSGMTSTLGLAFAATGWAFPFFSAMLGWMGVFLTGSDTSANALFGNLQVTTANSLGLNPVLTASVNSAAGVMGKMISLQSIAVAVAATGLMPADESRLFRFTLKHSIYLATVMGLIALVFAYVLPGWVPTIPSASAP